MPLLFDDPADLTSKKKRDTVGKTLERMADRGEAAKNADRRYTPAGEIAKALKHVDTRPLHLVTGGGHSDTATPADNTREAMRIAN